MTDTSAIKPRKAADSIAVFGGTFDPIHNGHISMLGYFLQRLCPDQCLVIPAGLSAHKSAVNASPEQRLAMLHLALAEFPVEISRREIDRATPSYTATTLEELRRVYPDSALTFCVGEDSLVAFTRWHRWEHILNMCRIAVARRRLDAETAATGSPLELPAEIQSRVQCVAEDAALPEYRVGQILLFEQPLYHQSSTEIRAQLSAGTLDQNQVPQPVLNYIQTHQLYI